MSRAVLVSLTLLLILVFLSLGANCPLVTIMPTDVCFLPDTLEAQEFCASLSPEEPGLCGSDSDGDGVGDECDGCWDDPNKTSPGNCGCGNSETPNCGGGQSNFEPGTYQGLVVQDSEIYSGGVLVDTDSRSSSQSIVINGQGLLSFSVGDTIVRWGLTTTVTSISVSENGNIIRLFYDAGGTIDGVNMSGSGAEFYTWLSSTSSFIFSGSVSVHTTNQTPELRQESTVFSTFVKW